MATLTQGLYPFEVVLLIGGIALFVTLLVGLIVGLVRGKIPKILVPLFVVAIVMIAYPGVQSFKYGELTVTLNNQLQQVLANPTNMTYRNGLAQVASQVASRPTANPAAIAALANAQYALGDEAAAQVNLNKVLRLDPTLPSAVNLRNKIASVEKLNQLTGTLQRNPADNAAARQLEEVASQVSQMSLANPKAIATLSTAQKLCGNQEAAQKSAQKAMAINPRAFQLQPAKP